MISVPGVGSGLDVSSLVSQLIAAEGNAKTVLLSNRRTDAQSQISAYGSVKSALSGLQSSLDSLKTSDGFSARSATSEKPEFFTVSVNSNAAVGSYDIEVMQLAEAHKISSAGFATEDSVVGTGTISIAVGSASFDIAINSDNQTVSQIRDAINDSLANTSVVATTINVDNGSGGTETRLLLTSEETGKANEITLTVTDDDANNTDTNGLSQLVYDPSGTGTTNSSQLAEALDAIIKVDDLTATRSTNTLNDVIANVTIDLQQADPGNKYSLTVSEDAPSIVNSVEAFVTEYNKLNSTINQLSAFNSETQTGAILLGDFTLRGIENQIKRMISDEVSGLIGPVRALVNLGITSNDDGSLSFDSEVLSDALQSDPTGVENFFSSDLGFANRLDSLIDGFVGAGELLDSKTDGLNARVSDIDNDLEDLNLRLQTMEERLMAQFSALDGLLAQLQTTSNFLAQNLATVSSSG